jgi:NitT/TauT family transport system ATP-binding protein
VEAALSVKFGGRKTETHGALSVAEHGVDPAGDGPVALDFAQISKVFPPGRQTRAFVALGGVSLSVQAASFVCLVGPSGCGKTTLLNLAAGLEQPTSGTVSYEGAHLRGRLNAGIGYLTQHNTLLPWRTVERNVAIPLELTHVSRSERAERAANALSMVGLSAFARHYPSQLSGGMQRRALLARTLISEPSLLLMDEPFGALDAQLRLSLQLRLLELWEEHRRTVLFVTHDLEEAILLGDRIVVMGANPGRIVYDEVTNLPRPRNFGQLRETSEFREIWRRLWKQLEPEMANQESESK